MEPAFRSRFEESLESGIKIIYRKPPFVHSKTLVCDDYVTIVGSTNIDKISLLSNQEVNVIIYDTSTALEHKEFLTAEQEGASMVDRSLVDSWDSSERFKQFMLGLIGRWL